MQPKLWDVRGWSDPCICGSFTPPWVLVLNSTSNILSMAKNLDVVISENWLDEASRKGQFSPSNPLVRPCIDFGSTKRTENARNSQKYYRVSDSHSPGIFTAQCACRYPKLTGISVMNEWESMSTALSVLMSRFRILAKSCYYDNVCNMLKSMWIRTLWVNEQCLIVSDRFYYRSHKCDIVNDPDSYSWCKSHSTSSAKLINQQWKFSKSHFWFLASKNLMPYLSTRAVFINMREWIREQNRTRKIDESHYQEFIGKFYRCSCILCQHRLDLCGTTIDPFEEA